MRPLLRALRLALTIALLPPSLALAAGVQPLFDLERPSASPFPADRFTLKDDRNNTGLRVNLPKPDCSVRPSDCQDIDAVNELDGFSLLPRLSIPLSGPIDVATVHSGTVFVLALGRTPRTGVRGESERGSDSSDDDNGQRIVGINRIVWDVATNTLHAEADELLDQHARYALIVTRGVRDATGDPIEASDAFERFRHDPNFGRTGDPVLKTYRKALLRALSRVREAGFPPGEIAAASVFTTQSITSTLEKIRDQIKRATPQPADFLLGPGGTRTAFPATSVTRITFNQHVSTAPAFTPVALLVDTLRIVPGAVGKIAFGKYLSPNYLTPQLAIPLGGTRSGIPEVQSMNEVFFNLFLPSGPTPPGGWPVVIYGHGSPGNKNVGAGGDPFRVAATLAAHGIATMATNAVGHGFGPLGTLTVNLAGGPQVTFSAGGRSIDQNGDGLIGASEGSDAPGLPTFTGLRLRDTLRQMVADLMQLVRVIEVGMDVDGDGITDLDPSRIYYLGFSFGAYYGTSFLATEPGLRAGTLLSGGGSLFDGWRLSPAGNRPALGQLLAARVPSLINVVDPSGIAFAEIAMFFASDGAVIIDPDGAGPLFEVPIVPPLPEDLNFIP